MESDHLAHFGVRLQCLWTFTLPNSIFGVVRATNNREATSIQAYSGCGVECGGAAQMLQTCQATRLYMLAPPSVRRTENNFYSLLSEGAQVPEVDSVFSPKTIPFPNNLEDHRWDAPSWPTCATPAVSRSKRCWKKPRTRLCTAEMRWRALTCSDSFITTLIVIVRRTQILVHPKPAFGLVLWC